MKNRLGIVFFSSSLVILAASITAPPVQSDIWRWGPGGSRVIKLARKIDKLEKHIDTYGSIVPKAPDVWGEARLTKYRKMVEEQLKARESKFDVRFSGAISRSDQAYLTSSLALQAAVSGTSAVLRTPNATNAETGDVTSTTTNILIPGAPTVVEGDPAPPHGGDLIGKSSFVDKDPNALLSNSIKFGGKPADQTAQFIQIEPTVELDQMNRYLKHLNELRRINDGDDISDAPGYALHLVRIPISILPGSKTREGYGAEVTVIAKPHIHDKLLSITFRQLVTNDVVDQLALPLAKMLDSGVINALVDYEKKVQKAKQAALVKGLKVPEYSYDPMVAFAATSPPGELKSSTEAEQDAKDMAKNEIKISLPELINDGLSSNTFRRSVLPFPTSQMATIYGEDNFADLVMFAKGLKTDPNNGESILLLDLQKLLFEEINAAYELLLANPVAWNTCSHELAKAIRRNDKELIAKIRGKFLSPGIKNKIDQKHLAALAWAIIVESALLNERLIQDMQELASAKNAYQLNIDWMDFYHPDPSPEAIGVFKEYVRVRWPIHVFAVDPVTEDQNVADSYTQRREMQLALSMALVSGKINGQQFTKYGRRTELAMDVIGLNRTVVGFSHGDDTFGWRFFPRIQTPPTPGTATVFFRDLLMGGPKQDDLLKKRRLEPGIRECTALVIMPSFVPYVIFDTRTNWFKLTNSRLRLPGSSNKEFSLSDAVRVSEEITEIKSLFCACQKDAHLYRKNEVYRLKRSVDQLDRRLPLQTKYVQVPYSNTHGGFEFFNNGASDLAPELQGFYGMPGVVVDQADSTALIEDKKETVDGVETVVITQSGNDLFLVGDNFSIHETVVIAGNKQLQNVELISRQILKVTIPYNVRSSKQDGTASDGGEGNNFVDVHIATPYGVSNHIHIPVIQPTLKPEAEKKVIAQAKKEVSALVKTAIKDSVGLAYEWSETSPKKLEIVLVQNDTNPLQFIDWDFDDKGGELELHRLHAAKEKELFASSSTLDLDLAFWATVTSVDEKVEAIKFPLKLVGQKKPLQLKKGKVLVSEVLISLGEQLMCKLPRGFIPKTVKLEGFVRTADNGLSVVKLGNSIEVSVEITNCGVAGAPVPAPKFKSAPVPELKSAPAPSPLPAPGFKKAPVPEDPKAQSSTSVFESSKPERLNVNFPSLVSPLSRQARQITQKQWLPPVIPSARKDGRGQFSLIK